MYHSSHRQEKGRRIAGLAVLAAMIVVLQTLASGFHVGPFPITLSLIPIIIGAVLYGPKAGAILGGVFGAVVVAAVVTGADAGGFIMFGIHPLITILVCLGKSIVAGWVAGLLFRAIAPKKFNLGIFSAAIAAPVINTGIFAAALYFFFYPVLIEWAGGESNAFTFIFTGLIGMNFLIELLIDIVLSPLILKIIQVLRKKHPVGLLINEGSGLKQ